MFVLIIASPTQSHTGHMTSWNESTSGVEVRFKHPRNPRRSHDIVERINTRCRSMIWEGNCIPPSIETALTSLLTTKPLQRYSDNVESYTNVKRRRHLPFHRVDYPIRISTFFFIVCHAHPVSIGRLRAGSISSTNEVHEIKQS